MAGVGACCEPRGYERIFTTGQAQREMKRYRKSGLRWGPRRTVELYKDGTITGRTMLEIGGGIGDLQVEMLRAGVESAVCVELSNGYDEAANDLLDRFRLTGRSVRIIGDVAAQPDLAEPADLVVMHDVICCYPDADRLVTAAASRARRHLVFTFPHNVWWIRAWAAVMNLYPRLRRSEFRFYAHPPQVIRGAAERAGLREVHTERTRVDTLSVYTA